MAVSYTHLDVYKRQVNETTLTFETSVRLETGCQKQLIPHKTEKRNTSDHF